jgi:hypothetical protein
MVATVRPATFAPLKRPIHRRCNPTDSTIPPRGSVNESICLHRIRDKSRC